MSNSMPFIKADVKLTVANCLKMKIQQIQIYLSTSATCLFYSLF